MKKRKVVDLEIYGKGIGSFRSYALWNNRVFLTVAGFWPFIWPMIHKPPRYEKETNS